MFHLELLVGLVYAILILQLFFTSKIRNVNIKFINNALGSRCQLEHITVFHSLVLVDSYRCC